MKKGSVRTDIHAPSPSRSTGLHPSQPIKTKRAPVVASARLVALHQRADPKEARQHQCHRSPSAAIILRRGHGNKPR
jgi:hypothetical protein